MKKLSAKIIEETLDYEDVTPKKEKSKAYSVQHYIGTFTESQLKAGAGNDVIYSLQDSQHFPDLQYVNHRINKVGKTEVWLSNMPGQYTINK
ncbi:MAG: hypothetical protein K5656_01875 [Lachnospiraceae bacterium]|nr:hypothetical protein [Lachnospiraceae bacterium]